MIGHWIWYPTLLPGLPPRVSLFTTWRDGFSLADGSDAFVRSVLAAVGIREAVRTWTLQRYRACYFSPDPDETQWNDLWPFTWKLDAELAAPPASLDVLDEGRREAEATDTTWSRLNPPIPATPARCLVIGDFRDAAAACRARSELAQLVPKAHLTEGAAFARFPQLHVDLGIHDDGWYQAGAAQAQAVRRVLVDHGAATFFEHSLTRARRATLS
jgi:hypothetical protein